MNHAQPLRNDEQDDHEEAADVGAHNLALLKQIASLSNATSTDDRAAAHESRVDLQRVSAFYSQMTGQEPGRALRAFRTATGNHLIVCPGVPGPFEPEASRQRHGAAMPVPHFAFHADCAPRPVATFLGSALPRSRRPAGCATEQGGSHKRILVEVFRSCSRDADHQHMTSSPIALGSSTTLHIGDALSILETLPSASVDAVVTDPPYAIKRLPSRVMSRPPSPQPDCTRTSCDAAAVCAACRRADEKDKFFAAPMLGQQSQNWHAKATHSRGYADNDPAQFQRWCALWLLECLRVLKPGGHLVAFGGTRTWHRLATAAEDSGFEIRDSLVWLYSSGMPKSLNVQRDLAHAGHESLGQQWSGWGSALRPAHEPVVLARRPLEGTMVNNVVTWGLGPLNLAGLSVPDPGSNESPRWPANVHLDDESARALGAHKGQDPSRAFWVSKPNAQERVVVDGIAHPTVKPLELMRRLVRMVTPTEGTVLDPFVGSGTTLEACALEGLRGIGIERDDDYVPLIQQRMTRHALHGHA